LRAAQGGAVADGGRVGPGEGGGALVVGEAGGHGGRARSGRGHAVAAGAAVGEHRHARLAGGRDRSHVPAREVGAGAAAGGGEGHLPPLDRLAERTRDSDGQGGAEGGVDRRVLVVAPADAQSEAARLEGADVHGPDPTDAALVGGGGAGAGAG